MDKIMVVVKNVGEPAEIKYIENTLQAKQSIVGGYIELVMLAVNNRGYDMIINEEGKIVGLEPNIHFFDDYIAGNLLVCNHNDEGEFTSLTEEEAKEIAIALNEIEIKTN